MVLLLGHSEDGRRQWEREGSGVLQKNYSRRKGNFLVYDPTFYHLCFSELDPDVFSGLRRFFRNPAEKIAGLRSGTFFRPKEDPGIYNLYNLLPAPPRSGGYRPPDYLFSIYTQLFGWCWCNSLV